MGLIYCRECGEQISETAKACPKCGAMQKGTSNRTEVKKCNWHITLLLSFFFGWLGVDRFYMGHIGLGIGKLLTFGGFLVWALIDFILILSKKVHNVEWEED